jgi:pSer/pThr/pTyr-binding forkhead associated (FHA) protein
MAKLVLSHQETVVDQCFLDDARITIGRARGNRIAVDDPSVADTQASISAVGHDYILEDLRGTGVVVNGTRTRRRILQHADVIELGAFNLRYVDTKASSEIDLDRTMLIPSLAGGAGASPGLDKTQDLLIPSSRASKARLPSGRVRFMNGDRRGQTQALTRVVATFGEPPRGVVVVTRRPKGFYVTYVEGDAQPRVNGESIGREPRHLHDGDLIEIAGLELAFALD